MNIYHELYKKSAFPLKGSEEAKKKCFVVWKDKRNQVFDAKRETLVYEKKDFPSNGKENKRPNKNILIKWKNDRKIKAAPKKRPPFVVGIVRHKIYSPPILHKSLKSEQKKKILRQSFAPKNYKFKPPEGLQKVKINVLNPIPEKSTSSPFTFNSLFIKQNQIVLNKKEHAFENVTVRPRAKPLTDSTPKNMTPKNTKIKKDVINQTSKDVKNMLSTDDTDEPPIFGKLNLLKFREKTAETNEVLNEASTSGQLSDQNIKISKIKDNSCASSCFDHQKEQESNIAKDSAEKGCNFKTPTLYSCSQQIQNLLEQEDFRFTELHSNSESNQIMKRTSEMPSPNLSRISFTSTDFLKTDIKIMASIEKTKENNNKEENSYFEYSGSPINDVLNVTIHADKSDVVDEETQNYFNLTNTPNITIPEYSNSKKTPTNKTVHEEKDSDVYQHYLPVSEINISPVKRMSKEKAYTVNEDNKSEESKIHNSLNLTPAFTEIKDNLERDEKVEHLNEKETSLEKIEFSPNGSETLKNENLETDSSILTNSKSSNEKNILTIFKDSDGHQHYLFLSDMNKSPVKRMSKEKVFIGNENNKNEEESKTHNSLNLTPAFIEIKNNLERDEKVQHLNEKETSLEKVEFSRNDSNSPKALENENLETDNSILNNSNSSNEENTLTIPRNFIVPKENMIPKADGLNEQEALKYPEVTIERAAATKKDNIVSTEILINNKTFELEELSPRDQINISNSQSKIIYSKTTLERDQKPVLEENNLNELSDNFIEHEKSTSLLKSQLSQTFTNDLDINKVTKTTENNEKQPEIIDLLDSPLKQEKVCYEKNPLLRKLHSKLTNNLYLSPRESMVKPFSSEIKCAESELSSTRKVLDMIDLEDSPKIEKESLITQNNFFYLNLKETQRSTADDCKSTIVLENNKNKLRNSENNEIETVDLISDDEEDVESYLSHIKARFAITTIASPKLNPERVALTSIENVLDSPSKALHSQTVLKDNSPKVQNISIFEASTRKTPQSSLLAKENSPAVTLASPMKNLSLRSRKEDNISPSSKKSRNSKILLAKNNLSDQMLKKNSNESNENRIGTSLLENTRKPTCKMPPSQVQTEENPSLVNDAPKTISLCVTPRQELLVEENSPTMSAATNQIRFLTLRNRKVDISPSPKKTRTPRKALILKNNLPGLNGQTPNSNSEELNENKIAESSSDIPQNSTCNTPRLQEHAKEKIPNSHIISCEMSLPQLLVNEKSPVISVPASPMNILSLRSRQVDVSPSPKKTRNTLRKALFTRTNTPDLNSQTPKDNADEINENRISALLLENVQSTTCNTSGLQERTKEKKIPDLHISTCEEPRPKLLDKENSSVTSTVSSPMRILCLRSRKVDVTPSPKKNTPKKTPRGKKTPLK